MALTSRGLDEADFVRVVRRPRARAPRSPRCLPDGPLAIPRTPPTPPQAEFFKRAVAVTKSHRATVEAKGGKKVADFRNSLRDDDGGSWPAELAALKRDVVAFARSFPVVGFDAAALARRSSSGGK